MKRAIGKHFGDFAALLAIVVIALGVGVYILSQQRLRFPLVEETPFRLKVELPDAQAVIPGQGQTVRVAGVRVGDIAKVDLEDGRAVVTVDLDREYDDLVHSDATALLRPKTGLKDMFIEIDPGSRSEPLLAENARIPVANTLPDIDPDEVLSALDHDTRDYLKLLLTGAGKGLDGRGDDLREAFARLGPLHRDLARVSRAIARRRANLRRLVHNYSSLTNELADKDGELTRLVDATNAVFESLAPEDENVSRSIARLPAALRQTSSTLAKVDDLSRVLGPALDDLRPAVRELDRANRELLPFGREAEPPVREEIRPFVRQARPFVRDLRPAAQDLAEATPDLTTSFFELNRFFNMAAFNENGAERLTGDDAADRARQESYLFWVAWAVHNGNSVFSTADASGPFRRITFAATCTTLRESIVKDEPALAPLLGVTDLLNDPGLCPEDAP
jgi:phospholipid/cholesterol/gamma-HCH transport system substrate-binding protein